MEQPRLVTLGQATPAIEGAWVAPSAILIGAVTLGPEASVWYATVLRADHDRITIGPRTNVQDGCVMHADPGLPVTVGTGVTVGHRAVLHSCPV
jgi:carbonic anhydrase/acetyltransferase-like protein (isoleucine patch superfamily)